MSGSNSGSLCCHQCKTKRVSPIPCSSATGKNCKLHFCAGCLRRHYPANFNVDKILQSIGTFLCPRCQGFCKCSNCIKKVQPQDSKSKETKPPAKKPRKDEARVTATSEPGIQWVGGPVSVGSNKTTLYYGSFRKDGDTFKLGDTVLLANGDAAPFIARIDAIWQAGDAARTPMMQGTWYFRRSDTPLADEPSDDAVADEHEVYLSRDIDDNQLASVLRRCTVRRFDLIDDVAAYLKLGGDRFYYRRLFYANQFFDVTDATLDAKLQAIEDETNPYSSSRYDLALNRLDVASPASAAAEATAAQPDSAAQPATPQPGDENGKPAASLPATPVGVLQPPPASAGPKMWSSSGDAFEYEDLSDDSGDPLRLITCGRYASVCDAAASSAPAAANSGAGVQPAATGVQQAFAVEVHSNALLAVDFHGHLYTSEVIGLLGGKWDAATRRLTVLEAFPCKSMGGCDSRNVEMDPVSEFEVRTRIQELGMRPVGWYHSHTEFCPDPSFRDCQNQSAGQRLALESTPSGNVEPWIGAICATFDPKLPSPSALFNWFVVQRRSSPETPTADLGAPAAVWHTIVDDADVPQALCDMLKQLAADSLTSSDRTDFAELWQDDVKQPSGAPPPVLISKLNKFRSSLLGRLSSLGPDAASKLVDEVTSRFQPRTAARVKSAGSV
eukprot:TRINITY_DN3295_c0_g1_i2.p1 TRINITY_DN3295_c0_g1~~TRINITY_DN3295_c0_g1_i2.p1  ORF type:complete len:670 (-),score=224.19 TRINITY_DN3295_c0_g1_i2:227-2236(-)